MKKNLLYVVLLFVIGQSAMAQGFIGAASPAGPKMLDNMKPVMKDQSYSTIINTNGSKVETMNAIKNYLIEYEVADSTELSVVDFDESMSEIKLRLGYRKGQTLLKGAMGAKTIAPPMRLWMDAIFAFNDENQMMITLTNFNGSVLCFVDDDGYVGMHKKSRCPLKDEHGDLFNEYDNKITEESKTILASSMAIVDALLLMSGYNEEQRESWRRSNLEDIRNRFKMYDDAVKKGSSEWITEDNIVDYKFGYFLDPFGKLKTNDNLQETAKEQVENYHSGNWVLGMFQYSWKQDFQDFFNGVFHDFAVISKGSIESVALDGEILYEQYEGKVVPVDPKERKKWLKKGYSL